MLETVQQQFPHLSYLDQMNIAIFALDFGKQERKEVWDIIDARMQKQLEELNK